MFETSHQYSSILQFACPFLAMQTEIFANRRHPLWVPSHSPIRECVYGPRPSSSLNCRVGWWPENISLVLHPGIEPGSDVSYPLDSLDHTGPLSFHNQQPITASTALRNRSRFRAPGMKTMYWPRATSDTRANTLISSTSTGLSG